MVTQENLFAVKVNKRRGKKREIPMNGGEKSKNGKNGIANPIPGCYYKNANHYIRKK